MTAYRTAFFLAATLLTIALLAACQSNPAQTSPPLPLPAPQRAPATLAPATQFAAASEPEASATVLPLPAPEPEASAVLAQLPPEALPLPTLTASSAPADLWIRLRQGFTWQPVVPAAGDSRQQILAQRVAQRVRTYQANPAHLQRTFERARLYLYDITQALEREGMPLELALLPAVESAFQTQVCSHAAACGLWQFISPTAQRFGLKQHLFMDERRHLTAATWAALRYLKVLHQQFGGDWHLALAAYNCGEGCIERAVKKAKTKGLAGRFEDLQLVEETAHYVPRLLALAQMVNHPDAHQLALPPMRNAPYFTAVPITRDIDVALAAKLAQLPLAEFVALNPQHKKPVIVAAGNAEIYLPVELASAFALALQRHQGALSSWVAVKLEKPAKLSALAQQHQVSVQTLAQTNHVKPGWVVASGSTLLLPRPVHGGQDIPAAVVEKGNLFAAAQPQVRRTKKGKNRL